MKTTNRRSFFRAIATALAGAGLGKLAFANPGFTKTAPSKPKTIQFHLPYNINPFASLGFVEQSLPKGMELLKDWDGKAIFESRASNGSIRAEYVAWAFVPATLDRASGCLMADEDWFLETEPYTEIKKVDYETKTVWMENHPNFSWRKERA